MADNAKRTGAALEAHHQFLLRLLPTVEKFPRSHKFALGDRIEAIALDVLEALIEATYTRDRAEALRSTACAGGNFLASSSRFRYDFLVPYFRELDAHDDRAKADLQPPG